MAQPSEQEQLAGPGERPIAQLQFRCVLSALDDMGIEGVGIGHIRKQEVSRPGSPALLVQLDQSTPGPAQPVHGPVV